jgi:hypothetical protein
MIKGIILFDIKDFLYQGQDRNNPDVELINQKQVETLGILHRDLNDERQRRINSNSAVPVVDIFLPTGDGYYLLCKPDLDTILDIARCIMALLAANGITAYCVAHLGDVNLFMDMTGKENATGFELGYASRLQSICKEDGILIVTKNLEEIWKENDAFQLMDSWNAATAKDGVEYRWKLASPIAFNKAIDKFRVHVQQGN